MNEHVADGEREDDPVLVDRQENDDYEEREVRLDHAARDVDAESGSRQAARPSRSPCA